MRERASTFTPEQRDSFSRRQSDTEFRKSLGSLETFKSSMKDRARVSSLESVAHSMDGKNILHHTYDLLQELRTDQLRDIAVQGITTPLPELARAVALYHDLDKAVEGVMNKRRVAEEAIAEIDAHDPTFFGTDADRALFIELFETCDYLGYNLAVLQKRGVEQVRALDAIIEEKIDDPLDRLSESYPDIDIEADDLLRIQAAISRADTLAIEPFKQNIAAVDLVAQKLLERLT